MDPLLDAGNDPNNWRIYYENMIMKYDEMNKKPTKYKQSTLSSDLSNKITQIIQEDF